MVETIRKHFIIVHESKTPFMKIFNPTCVITHMDHPYKETKLEWCHKKEFISNFVFAKSMYGMTLSTSFNLTVAFEVNVLDGYWSLIYNLS